MLDYKKFSFWIITVSMVIVIIVGIVLITNPKQENSNEPEDILAESSAESKKVSYYTEFNKVKIEFLSGTIDFKSVNELETTDLKIVGFIDSTLQSSLIPAKENDFKNDHTNQYAIKLSNDIGEFSCKLYYDTLDDKAYIVKDGGIYEVGTDFVRYIDSLLEDTTPTNN